MNEEDKIKETKLVLQAISKAFGADIMPPEEMVEEELKTLSIEKDMDFHKCLGKLIVNKNRVNIIKGLTLSCFSAIELLNFSEYLRSKSIEIAYYASIHPVIGGCLPTKEFLKDLKL